MHDNFLFKKQPVAIQNSSGFDLSFEHIFTGKVGTLVPCLSKQLIPGQKVHLNLKDVEIQLPPLATSFYGKLDAKFEAFFVPHRIIDNGWKNLIENTKVGSTPKSVKLETSAFTSLTTAEQAMILSWFGRGSLLDYLGFKQTITANPAFSSQEILNLHPIFAYHKIYDDWYRNPLVQTAIMTQDTVFGGTLNVTPWRTNMNGQSISNANINALASRKFADTVHLLDLRQRNYSKGYFTSCTPQPQYGSEASVSFDTSGTSGSFSIATLRAANSLQKFCERNNIAGGRYADLILGQYGVLPADALTDRPIFLGSHTVPVYSRSVFNTAGSSGTSTRNPLSGSVASQAGAASGFGSGHLGSFKATEHGTLMVIFSLCPRAIYSTGMNRELMYSSYSDYPNPMLAGIGNQLVLSRELFKSAAVGSVFGYQDRYAEAKYIEDMVSGLFADGESLENFVLKRSFTTPPTINTSFIQIPTTALDDVSAVAGDISKFGCLVDVQFGFGNVAPLPAYSVPTLGDEKNTHSILVDKGGRYL